MPELPEVETIVRGLKPHLQGLKIAKVLLRQPKLRWPVPLNLQAMIQHQTILDIHRRGKYMVMRLDEGYLLIHLGMSGRLCLIKCGLEPQKHDHLDVHLDADVMLRYTDPRRFGSIHWVNGSFETHFLLKHLGVEPLTADFDAEYLLQKAHGRRVPIKSLIMNSHIVVGVGNIYAAEALFLARINPWLQASLLQAHQAHDLVLAIKKVLHEAIQQGGTTLKDFANSEGKPGYFAQSLHVYGRGGKSCAVCFSTLVLTRLGQRSTVHCPTCQTL